MVLGDGVSDARAGLEAAGFQVYVVRSANVSGLSGCRDPNVTASGFVWREDPCAGELAGRGSTVTIAANP